MTELQKLKKEAQESSLKLKDDEQVALKEQKDVLDDINAELKAMDKATDVLLMFKDKQSGGDDSAGSAPNANSTDTSFLQLRSEAAASTHGRFDGVQKVITKRISDKKQETARAVKKKAQCEKELGAMASQLEGAEQQEEQGRANKHKVKAEMKELKEAYAQLEEHMESLDQSQKELKQIQAERKDLHVASQAERIEALRVFAQAKEILQKELHDKGKTIYATIDYIMEKIKKEQNDATIEFRDATAEYDENLKNLGTQAESAYEEYSVKRSRYAETEVEISYSDLRCIMIHDYVKQF